MTYVIAEPCVDVMDQGCVSVCPVDCIHFDEGTDRMLYIDPNECIDCGACEPECPVNAIFPEEACRPNGRSTPDQRDVVHRQGCRPRRAGGAETRLTPSGRAARAP
jgi:NAD-dependent dihydropyrimidine dehydrogenase PreA subunit